MKGPTVRPGEAQSAQPEHTFDVHWYGPFSTANLEKAADPSFVLYAVYSTHPLYGKDVLVYIGRTEQGLDRRIKQHQPWTQEECDQVTVYAAAIAPFESWSKAAESEVYLRPETEIVERIEALLIYAHQPAYNRKSKDTAHAARGYRIFNTGKFGALLPEVSAKYYLT